MIWITAVVTALAWFADTVAAQSKNQKEGYVVPFLSLPESLPPSGQSIQGFNAHGTAQSEKNKIILTNLHNGIQAGSIWSKQANIFDNWQLDFEFRAVGTDRPGGGLALWYTADGNEPGTIQGSKDNWDGLGILIDYTTGQGTVRGHLNDKSITYGLLSHPQMQSFAGCAIEFRNSDDPIKVKLIYRNKVMTLLLENQKCFTSDEVNLPNNYIFGASALTFDTPDQFEIYKFQVSALPPFTPEQANSLHVQVLPEDIVNEIPPVTTNGRSTSQSGTGDDHATSHTSHPDISGDIKTMFDNLQDMVQAINSQLQEIKSKSDQTPSIHSSVSTIEGKINGLEDSINGLNGALKLVSTRFHESATEHRDALHNLAQRLDRLERSVREHSTSLLSSMPQSMLEAVTKGAPNVWKGIYMVIAFQIVFAFGYIIYSRRRDRSHLKYL